MKHETSARCRAIRSVKQSRAPTICRSHTNTFNCISIRVSIMLSTKLQPCIIGALYTIPIMYSRRSLHNTYRVTHHVSPELSSQLQPCIPSAIYKTPTMYSQCSLQNPHHVFPFSLHNSYHISSLLSMPPCTHTHHHHHVAPVLSIHNFHHPQCSLHNSNHVSPVLSPHPYHLFRVLSTQLPPYTPSALYTTPTMCLQCSPHNSDHAFPVLSTQPPPCIHSVLYIYVSSLCAKLPHISSVLSIQLPPWTTSLYIFPPYILKSVYTSTNTYHQCSPQISTICRQRSLHKSHNKTPELYTQHVSECCLHNFHQYTRRSLLLPCTSHENTCTGQ